MTGLTPEVVDLEPQEALAMRGDVAPADLPSFFERAFVAVAAAAKNAGVELVGPPFGFYPEMPAETVALEAGFPVSSPVETADDVHALTLPGGRAVLATHVGPYETMVQTYVELEAWMTEQGLRPAKAMWECYLSDPAVEPDPTSWRTRIIWPVASSVSPDGDPRSR